VAEVLAEFFFTVGKAFLGSGHPITIPQGHRNPVHGALGWIENQSHPVSIVTCSGVEVAGTIRHSINNGGQYLQLNSSDPDVADGLTVGQTIRVEVLRGDGGVHVQLES
jgi:hypothetical protein